MQSNDIGFMEDDIELELELGLSIGRTHKSSNQNEVVSRENDQQLSFFQRSSVSPNSFMNTQQQEEERAEEEEEEMVVVVDPRKKREIQALRRQVVKRKREVKRFLKKRGLFCINGEEPFSNSVTCNGLLKNVKFNNFTVEMNEKRPVMGSGRWGRPSLGGGNSSENKSHLTQSSLDLPQADGSKAHDLRSESEHSAISQKVVTAADNNQTNPVQANASNAPPSTLSRAKADDKSDAKGADLTQKHFTSTENSIPFPMRQCNVDKGKHHKPNCNTSTLPLLPCVSTKGNGPNGKTINGFLYRYTETEVSIVCVCHGTSFSPAEFVQHAGGTDVTHPLRHITVVPSAF